MRGVILFGILLLGCLQPGFSQVSLGVKAGVPLNDAINTVDGASNAVTTNTDRWLVGPTVEIHLPFRLSFEADALYRREGYTPLSLAGLAGAGNQTINDWQFPFLGKYEFRREVIRPFVDAGVTYRHLSGAGALSDANNAGFTVGGGITAKLLFLRISPEIRYTRWGSGSVLNNGFVTRSQNQADFLLGFTF